ncbi:TetR/AcrR family transcriptional regulator [Lactobacillus sp. DCY120]|uniref:TetR/AcrR family transcriptional regulator n=1 Tax=Bombilactobacillus apium TaxID=2675299 RepID=A0A850R009_9LACO|nr:TetR/AcrR family transcriptional regulator [Bombilactobacillus apium]NVY96379.1 TetR/AcrR family transcriptional regulator [Bombilactobacillus apium]
MGRREDKARLTRAKLLQAAERLIVEHGYEKVTVTDLVEASGIAKGTFYNYFSRKEDLILELSKQHFASIAHQEIDLGQTATENIQQYLVNFMTVIAQAQVELARQWLRYVAVAEQQAKWQFDTRSLKRLFQQLEQAGKLTATSVNSDLADALLTQMYGLILLWCMSPTEHDLVTATQQFCMQHLEDLIAPYQLAAGSTK